MHECICMQKRVNFNSLWGIGAVCCYQDNCRADSRFVPSQWETSLQSNGVSHWLGANLESIDPLQVSAGAEVDLDKRTLNELF